MAGVKGRSGRKPNISTPTNSQSPSITTIYLRRLRGRLLEHLCRSFTGVRGFKPRRMLIDRLVNAAGWYLEGITFWGHSRNGRRPDVAVQVLLSDCAFALHVVTGKPASLWQRDIEEVGSPESEAVKLARIVADVMGKPLHKNLRRQIAASRMII